MGTQWSNRLSSIHYTVLQSFCIKIENIFSNNPHTHICRGFIEYSCCHLLGLPYQVKYQFCITTNF